MNRRSSASIVHGISARTAFSVPAGRSAVRCSAPQFSVTVQLPVCTPPEVSAYQCIVSVMVRFLPVELCADLGSAGIGQNKLAAEQHQRTS